MNLAGKILERLLLSLLPALSSLGFTQQYPKNLQQESRMRCCYPVLSVFALGACTSAEPTRPSETSAIVALTKADALTLAREQALKGLRGIEDEFVNLEARAAGFAGFYLDRSGVLVIRRTAAAADENVKAEVLRSVSARPTQFMAAEGSPVQIRLESANHTITDLIAFKEMARVALREFRAIAFDADEAKNRLTVAVGEGADIAAVSRALLAARVPENGFDIVVMRDVRELDHLTDRFRPTGGGIKLSVKVTTTSLDWAQPCSLGFNVTQNGLRYALTASHCNAVSYPTMGQTGTSVYQNVLGTSNNKLGTVRVNPLWNLTEPGCGGVQMCRRSDAMLMEYQSGISAPSRIFHPPSPSTTEAPGSTLILSSGATFDITNASGYTPFVGQSLGKVGMTTGWSEGPVTLTCVDFTHVKYTDYKTDLCADVVLAYADGGDSGGPVFYRDYSLPLNTRVPMGILWGSAVMWEPVAGVWRTHFMFSRRASIEHELGVLTF